MRAIIAVDIEHRPEALIAEALGWLADRSDLSVDLVYVFELTPAVGMIHEPLVWQELAPQWERPFELARERLETLLGAVPKEARGRALVPMGAPARVIADMSGDYDLVVVGTHQRRGLPRMWLGSQSEQVVRASTVPVLVIPLPRA